MYILCVVVMCKQSVLLMKSPHTMDSWCQHSVVFLAVLLASLPLEINSQCDVLSQGGYIERTLHIREAVCDVMHTAIIAKDHILHLEPGVKLRFAPGVMLAVNGTLLAKVDKTCSFCVFYSFIFFVRHW